MSLFGILSSAMLIGAAPQSAPIPVNVLQDLTTDAWKPQVSGLASQADGSILVLTVDPNFGKKQVDSDTSGKLWKLTLPLEGKPAPAPTLVAENLDNPMGVAILDGFIYVSERSAIVRLNDTNKDGFYDSKTVVANSWESTRTSHLTTGLIAFDDHLFVTTTGAANFGNISGDKPGGTLRGSVLRIDPRTYDANLPARNTEVVASGLSLPDGLAVNLAGVMVSSNSFGSARPFSEIQVVQLAGNYGGSPSVSSSRSNNFDDQPLVPAAIVMPSEPGGNTPGQPEFIEHGLFEGQFLIPDVRNGNLRRAWIENVNGTWQGGFVTQTTGLHAGPHRLLSAPGGRLIIGEIGNDEGWAWTDPTTHKASTEGLELLTPSTAPRFEIANVQVVQGGIKIDFTKELSAIPTAKSFSIETWSYDSHHGFAKSASKSITDFKIQYSKTDKSVVVTTNDLTEGSLIKVEASVSSADRESLTNNTAYYTLNRLPVPVWNPSTALTKPNPRVLVFSKTAAFRHSSIETGIQMIRKLGLRHHFSVFATEDSSIFETAAMNNFDVVVFLSTTGDVLNAVQQNGFERFIRNGGGYVGIHAAADTEYEWPWYGGLVGSYFARHPAIQVAPIHREIAPNPATCFLPETWNRVDEWYDYRTVPADNVDILATLVESGYEGGGMGANHPHTWAHEFDGGRAFYTGRGHTEATYDELLFQEEIYQAIVWTAQTNRPVGAQTARFGKHRWQSVLAVQLAQNGDLIELSDRVGSDALLSNGTTGPLISEQTFTDALIHLEFCLPSGGTTQVLLQGNYLLNLNLNANSPAQLTPAHSGGIQWGMTNEGAVGKAPIRSATKRAGQWQAVDILFRGPRFDRQRNLISNAQFQEVRLNGVVVQSGCEAPVALGRPSPIGPLVLTDGTSGVAYRNVWITPLQ